MATRDPGPTHQLRLVDYPIIYRVWKKSQVDINSNICSVFGFRLTKKHLPSESDIGPLNGFGEWSCFSWRGFRILRVKWICCLVFLRHLNTPFHRTACLKKEVNPKLFFGLWVSGRGWVFGSVWRDEGQYDELSEWTIHHWIWDNIIDYAAIMLDCCSNFPPGRYCSGRNPSKKSTKAAKFRESKWTWYQAMTKQGLPYINHNTYSLNVITGCFFFAPRHLHEWLSFLINLGQ